jgi:hypothetical protein
MVWEGGRISAPPVVIARLSGALHENPRISRATRTRAIRCRGRPFRDTMRYAPPRSPLPRPDGSQKRRCRAIRSIKHAAAQRLIAFAAPPGCAGRARRPRDSAARMASRQRCRGPRPAGLPRDSNAAAPPVAAFRPYRFRPPSVPCHGWSSSAAIWGFYAGCRTATARTTQSGWAALPGVQG